MSTTLGDTHNPKSHHIAVFETIVKDLNACSYALTWVDVGFNMKISVAVFLNAMSPGDSLFLRLHD